MTIAISPVPGYPKEGTQLRVDDGRVRLGITIDCQYTILSADGAEVSVPARNTLTEDQYGKWTGDDTFVCQCVAENVGLKPA